jgi:hypothetical protein
MQLPSRSMQGFSTPPHCPIPHELEVSEHAIAQKSKPQMS